MSSTKKMFVKISQNLPGNIRAGMPIVDRAIPFYYWKTRLCHKYSLTFFDLEVTKNDFKIMLSCYLWDKFDKICRIIFWKMFLFGLIWINKISHKNYTR